MMHVVCGNSASIRVIRVIRVNEIFSVLDRWSRRFDAFINRMICRRHGHDGEAIGEWHHEPRHSIGPMRCKRCGVRWMEKLVIHGGYDGDLD